MNNQQFQTHWASLQAKIKQKWPKFNDLDLKQVNGQKDKFVNQLQQKYGINKDQAERELAEIGKGLTGAAGGPASTKGSPQPNRPGTPQQPNRNPKK